ncbi:MAG: HAD-IC family P-type ATPase [Candidatus Brocadiae bacterium]|nr:HAD-IC family P-type ATPase [Candidatus Brocadiia bacterium]
MPRSGAAAPGTSRTAGDSTSSSTASSGMPNRSRPIRTMSRSCSPTRWRARSRKRAGAADRSAVWSGVTVSGGVVVAMVRGGPLVPADGFSQLRGRAVLLGLFGQLDPPRPEVAEAVETCRKAGIRAVMVTGDHKVTGRAVAGMLGMAREGEISVDGPELARMSEGDLASKLDTIAVFARVHPAQKMRIVEAYQRRGDVVAMTGDGVNDAPALARADVGVAMGLTGTDVAKEAAKIIVTDDNFATIVSAVEEGRLVYRNIKKVVLYLFSTSMAEVLVLTAALVLGYPPPLAAVQILWINIVTEGTVTVNLIMERSEGDEMLQPPIPRGEPLLTAALLRRVLFMTPSIALSTFGWFVVRTSQGVPAEQVRTETFTVLAVCQWFNVLNCRSATASALNFRVLTNPWLVTGLILSNLLHMAVIFLPPLQAVFHTVAIPWKQVFAIGAAASLVLWVEEIRKWIVRRSLPRAAPAPQAPTPRA